MNKLPAQIPQAQQTQKAGTPVLIGGEFKMITKGDKPKNLSQKVEEALNCEYKLSGMAHTNIFSTTFKARDLAEALAKEIKNGAFIQPSTEEELKKLNDSLAKLAEKKARAWAEPIGTEFFWSLTKIDPSIPQSLTGHTTRLAAHSQFKWENQSQFSAPPV